MLKINLYLLVLILTACQSSPKGENQFYTWVDESGQIRTIKKQDKSASEQPSADKVDNDMNYIERADYVSSDVMDKIITEERLYSWQDEQGRQIVYEESPVESEKLDINSDTQSVNIKSHSAYREGRQIIFSEIQGKELKLQRLLRSNEKTNRDYALIELDTPVSAVHIKSYISDNKIALPLVLPLTKDFKQIYRYENLFAFYEPETWYGYGYLHSQLNVPTKTKYLLLLTNPKSDPISINEKLIRQTNFGSISIMLAN